MGRCGLVVVVVGGEERLVFGCHGLLVLVVAQEVASCWCRLVVCWWRCSRPGFSGVEG